MSKLYDKVKQAERHRLVLSLLRGAEPLKLRVEPSLQNRGQSPN